MIRVRHTPCVEAPANGIMELAHDGLFERMAAGVANFEARAIRNHDRIPNRDPNHIPHGIDKSGRRRDKSRPSAVSLGQRCSREIVGRDEHAGLREFLMEPLHLDDQS